jgi:hypothetical protein
VRTAKSQPASCPEGDTATNLKQRPVHVGRHAGASNCKQKHSSTELLQERLDNCTADNSCAADQQHSDPDCPPPAQKISTDGCSPLVQQQQQQYSSSSNSSSSPAQHRGLTRRKHNSSTGEVQRQDSRPQPTASGPHLNDRRTMNTA